MKDVQEAEDLLRLVVDKLQVGAKLCRPTTDILVMVIPFYLFVPSNHPHISYGHTHFGYLCLVLRCRAAWLLSSDGRWLSVAEFQPVGGISAGGRNGVGV